MSFVIAGSLILVVGAALALLPMFRCSFCGGSGRLIVPADDAKGLNLKEPDCELCAGRGRMTLAQREWRRRAAASCKNCGGSGRSRSAPVPCDWCYGSGRMSPQRETQYRETWRQIILRDKY